LASHSQVVAISNIRHRFPDAKDAEYVVIEALRPLDIVGPDHGVEQHASFSIQDASEIRRYPNLS
jgi:hypothetical protein